MFMFLTSAVGVAGIAAYVYCAVMFGTASNKAGNSVGRVFMDALTWPVMGWKAIMDLKNADPNA